MSGRKPSVGSKLAISAYFDIVDLETIAISPCSASISNVQGLLSQVEIAQEYWLKIHNE